MMKCEVDWDLLHQIFRCRSASFICLGWVWECRGWGGAERTSGALRSRVSDWGEGRGQHSSRRAHPEPIHGLGQKLKMVLPLANKSEFWAFILRKNYTYVLLTIA